MGAKDTFKALCSIPIAERECANCLYGSHRTLEDCPEINGVSCSDFDGFGLDSAWTQDQKNDS